MIDWTEYNWREAAAVVGLDVNSIATVLAASEDDDGTGWICAFVNKDGKFGLLSAWCDYTGWDCRSGGRVEYADSLEELCRLVMDNDQRYRLGYDVFGQHETEE